MKKLINVCSNCQKELTKEDYCTSEEMYGHSVVARDEDYVQKTVWYVSICCGAEVTEEVRKV